tara:strand:+ start:3502 stop:3612 length:111 start_codon:yes stop_codon:yes gene_type:complete
MKPSNPLLELISNLDIVAPENGSEPIFFIFRPYSNG